MILGVQGGIQRAKEKAFYDAKGQRYAEYGVRTGREEDNRCGSQMYWNWQADENTYPNLKENIKELKKRGSDSLLI